MEHDVALMTFCRKMQHMPWLVGRKANTVP